MSSSPYTYNTVQKIILSSTGLQYNVQKNKDRRTTVLSEYTYSIHT